MRMPPRDAAAAKAKPPEKKAEDFLDVDPMRVEIGGASCRWPIQGAAVT